MWWPSYSRAGDHSGGAAAAAATAAGSRVGVGVGALRIVLVIGGCLLAMVSISIADTHIAKPARPVRSVAGLTTWPTRQQELADEANDAQLLHAVQKSMREWRRAHLERLQQTQLETRRRRRRRRRRAAATAAASSSGAGGAGGAEKSVCYGDLGCFEDSGPFGYLDMLPSPPEEINTRFMFYSTKNRSDNPLFEIPFLNISDAWRDLQRTANQSTPAPAAASTRNSKRWHALKTFPALTHSSVRIIVHGFGSACPHVWIYELRTALMAVEDCVVICVDWENGANFPNYVRAAANTRLVGKQLAMFLRGLQQYKRLDLNRVHLIGFSLGAHVSGFAGAELPGISRITGLDPAGPLFESQHPKARLDSSDATFVDVIHSNGENLILGGLGSWQPMGHVDFYPNGGRVQHGCSNLFVGAVTDFIWSPAAAVEGRSLCNHRRAYKFFIDSVAPRCLFPAFPCANYDDFLLGQCFPCDANGGASSSSPASTSSDLQSLDGYTTTISPLYAGDGSSSSSPSATFLSSGGAKCGNMGYYADRSTGRGQLYLVTREEEPFCAHQFTIEIHSPPNDLPLRTLGKLEAVLTGDGQLNETFSITEKDDTEFYAGERVSRILVPHPALGFPHAVTLRYKSYSGWLTKGLPQWTVHKVVLADSFGARRSLCRADIALYSDRPVYLALEQGDCVAPVSDEDEHGDEDVDENATARSTTVTTAGPGDAFDVNTVNNADFGGATTEMSGKLDADAGLRDKKEVIELGKSYPIQAGNIQSADTENLIDAPSQATQKQQQQQRQHENNIKRYVKTGHSSATESGRSIQSATSHQPDTSELRLQFGLRPLHTKRNEEPLLRSTTLRSASTATADAAADVSPMRPRENSVFTIQLLPFRLGELIERAERYARETLLPLISEQAPRIFRFGETAATTATSAFGDLGAPSTRNARHLRYQGPTSGASSSAGTPITGAQLSLIAAAADGAAIPMAMRRQRRIDLPPALNTAVRIEAADFDAAAPPKDAQMTARVGREKQPQNLLRPTSGGRTSEVESGRRLDATARYYTRDSAEVAEEPPTAAMRPAAEEDIVRISLPTYRPDIATTTTTPEPPPDVLPPKVMIVTAIPIPLSMH